MTNSSRFTVAVHVLTLLAHEDGKALTSDYIAGSVNTNPVVIRRVLGLLSKAGLISTTEGARGGTVLAKPAKRISLADVLRAVEQGELFALPPNEPNPLCPVGRCVQTILGEHLERLQGLLERAMKRVSVAEILEEVKSGSRR
jgi:Rrf2 family protein